MTDDVERSETGDPILRHEAPIGNPGLVSGNPELIEDVTAHIERHIGPVRQVFHEIISPRVHIDLHWVPPGHGRSYNILVTSGMSERPMIVPDETAEFAYAELVIVLPSSWPIDVEAFKDEQHYWPIRLLKQLARLPHEHGTWVAYGHTVGNGNPPEPFAPSTAQCGTIVLPPLHAGDEFFTLARGADQLIHFWSIVPLYREEMDFKMKKGTDALLELFEGNDITDVIDPNRMNVAVKRLFGFL